ncbi:uncharacterized protein LOC134326446 [Trichomycterus rosablanca]|uniref:uncharacterized protein LOC134326446 n=1 Tax=Trichomycterus rosablanca TaxID=2290929 RepID=UPI002F35AAB8
MHQGPQPHYKDRNMVQKITHLPCNKMHQGGPCPTSVHGQMLLMGQHKARVFYLMSVHLLYNKIHQGGPCPTSVHGQMLLRGQDKTRVFYLMSTHPPYSRDCQGGSYPISVHINMLSLSGGHTMKKTIWRIASKVFTSNLAKSLNWCGRGDKRGLKQTACGQVIIAAAMKNPVLPAPTEAEAEKCLKDYFPASKKCMAQFWAKSGMPELFVSAHIRQPDLAWCQKE